MPARAGRPFIVAIRRAGDFDRVVVGARVMAGLAATDEDRTISVADLLRVVAALPQPPGPRPERDAA